MQSHFAHSKICFHLCLSELHHCLVCLIAGCQDTLQLLLILQYIPPIESKYIIFRTLKMLYYVHMTK